MPVEKKDFSIKANEFDFAFNETDARNLNLFKVSPAEYNVIKDFRSVNATITSADIAAKKITVEVEGDSYVVEIKNNLDQMLEQMGFGATSAKQIKEIKAPMPGLVLQVAVEEGQAVKEGERLLILEAMKMENSITLHTDAVIKKVRVKSGQAVDKGQVLVELE